MHPVHSWRSEGNQPDNKLNINLKEGHTYPHQATVTVINRAFNLQTEQSNLPNTDNPLHSGDTQAGQHTDNISRHGKAIHRQTPTSPMHELILLHFRFFKRNFHDSTKSPAMTTTQYI